MLGSEEVHALREINLNIFPGQFVAVVGRSGSGKTTLLNIMAGLDRPSGGHVLFEERDLANMSEDELTELRRHRIGFVFQSFGLLPLLSAMENVELPLRISG
ncbi:MAG: ABC transporter ATP-binding protein, partial [Chloroflexi bacterium]|nr:ABC transporter ATP-binding protein [Chloroflexota bacterium]